MYVNYFVSSRGNGLMSIWNDPAFAMIGPSDCQWIVPGTVDPRDD